jgi:N-acetylneuraminate synthase
MPSERSVDVDTATDLELARVLLAVRPMPNLEIAGRKIGPGHPCFIIAEAGVNHNGSLEIALKLVDAAADAGADAVKFQTFRTEAVVTRDAPKAAYQRATTNAFESQFEMIKKLELSEESHYKLAEHAKRRGLVFLSTPFDEGSADFLESLSVPAFKIPSGELTNLPFLQHIARKGLPMIISTGMATFKEVDAAVSAIRVEGRGDIALLHCVSNYPAAPADVNLRAMATLREAFSVPVGYSDHTLGTSVPLAAVALGACIVEKHFTLDQTFSGPDHKASASPSDLAALVVGIRKVEAALGTGLKEPSPSETDTARVARRSLVAVKSIPRGAVVEPDMIGARRPGTGMALGRAAELLGRRAVRDIAEGTLLAPEMFE